MGWGNFWKGLKSSLPLAHAKLQEGAEELESRFGDDSDRHPLSPELQRRLEDRLDRLIPSDRHCQVLRDRLNATLQRWHADRNALNGLAVLGRPTTDVTAIVTEALHDWIPPDFQDGRFGAVSWDIRWLPDTFARHDTEAALAALRETFGDRPDDRRDPESQRLLLAVVPDLGRCMLRCVEGLDAIDGLQAWVSSDRRRFWLVGCNTWTWDYLDRVCQIGNSFEETLYLPALDPEHLQQQLDELGQTVSCQFEPNSDRSEDAPQSASASESEDDDAPWQSQAQQEYFERLADRALGCSEIAARLWLRSLYERPDNDGVFVERPSLPDLPRLTKADRFLLYAVGLHGSIAIANLATALGESELSVWGQVRPLQRSDVVEFTSDRHLRLSPSHYPRLHNDLKNNQFLVGDGDRA